MIGKEQMYHVLDRDFPVDEIRVLGEFQWVVMVTYESGQLHMVPDVSIGCQPGHEFVKVPEDVLVLNPAGVVSDPKPNEFYLSIGDQEGLHYLLCCGEFPERTYFSGEISV